MEESEIITTEGKITVVAKSGEDILDEIDLFVGSVEPLDVPLNSTDIFTFTMTNNPGDTITGFSDKVKNDPSILVKNYNGLDFSGQEKVKYISGDCQFNVDTTLAHQSGEHKKIFELWKPFEINFGSLTFLPNEEGMTGCHLFYEADLNSLITLNFNHSKWAPTGTSYSAECVFEGANLSGVINLNLKDAVFASTKMISNERDDYPYVPTVWTASGTFLNSDLSNLVILDLSDIEFAIDDMNVSECEFCTAESTFDGCKFDSLEELNLENTLFAASGMTTGESDEEFLTVSTATTTFYSVKFPKLTSLNLTNTVFAAEGMSEKLECVTAEGTFYDCEFTLLEQLDLENVVFATKEMTSSCVHTASATFELTKFPNLTSLNLNDANFAVGDMGAKEIYTASSTFYECNFDLLEKLNLENTVFAKEEMTSSGEVYSGEYTFGACNFSSLKELELKNAMFADEEMNVRGETLTGHSTFDNANFPMLDKLDLREANLFATDMNENNEIASYMFYDTVFSSSFHDLYLPEDYEGEYGNWERTFANDQSVDYSSLFVHGYKTSPTWFANSNLTDAVWVKNIPITEDFFNLTSSEDDGVLDTVNGFSEEVIGGSNSLEPFNALEFDYDNSDIKFISEVCSFRPWDSFWETLCLLSFDGLNFSNNSDVCSGEHLLTDCSFNSLVELNLSNTIWADKNTKKSGYCTFFGCVFTSLKELNFKNAVFAAEGMESNDIETASETFWGCVFTSLKELNFKNAVFAAGNYTPQK